MKAVLLFAGETYYPGGGWEDFVQDCDSVDEAIAWFDEHNADIPHSHEGHDWTTKTWDWGHVAAGGKIVAEYFWHGFADGYPAWERK